MEKEFIYWQHSTPPGIRVEEVSGGEGYPSKVRQEMATQIFCEHGEDAFREIMHFNSGAPVIKGVDARISISHTPGLYVVAFLPTSGDADLSIFSEDTAMGIDVEKFDREKVLKVRQKFLNDRELERIPADDLAANILAWTAKEALIKASLNPAINYREDIEILRLPKVSDNPVKETSPETGEAVISQRNGEGVQTIPMRLYSYDSDGYCVTLAYSPQITSLPGEKRSK